MMISELRDWWEREQERYAALPAYRKFLEDALWWLRYGICHEYRNLKFAVRVRVNRAVRGYDESDWWEYYSNASERAVKLLTLLRDRGTGYKKICACDSFECACDNAKLWKEALSDMIFFHSVCAGLVEGCGGTICDFDNLTEEAQRRYRRGKYLYVKHYEGLWD